MESSHRFVLNGQHVTLSAESDMPLLWAIRERLGLTGTKFGCGIAQCGACTVLIDGEPARSCVMPVQGVDGRKVTTIEGLAQTDVGRRLQAAWVAENVPQCGYCQSGMLVESAALLTATPKPDDAAVDAAIDGHICRCGTYPRIRRAINHAAGR